MILKRITLLMTWMSRLKCARVLIALFMLLFQHICSFHWFSQFYWALLLTPVLCTIKAYSSLFSQESSSHVMQWCLPSLTLRTVCLISVAPVAPQWHCAKLFKAMLTCALKLGCQLTGEITPSAVSVWALQAFCKAPFINLLLTVSWYPF